MIERLGGGAASPDLRFGYQPDETYRLLALYGPAGIAHFRRLLWIDMVFPGVYAAFFGLITLEWAQWGMRTRSGRQLASDARSPPAPATTSRTPS
ncbi:hypothetical protein FE844_028000 (plasmid) [Rhizobium indicum]|uniref:hypothetical protein n=1 Tax=Rhizobium indicum TaxID=2583231 RepID=UPI001105FE6A|nr:hypothetical protein [Rhizobium indicum]QKK33386.1 hypothetical protein FE844_028000 [Rhizobium indicum]